MERLKIGRIDTFQVPDGVLDRVLDQDKNILASPSPSPSQIWAGHTYQVVDTLKKGKLSTISNFAHASFS